MKIYRNTKNNCWYEENDGSFIRRTFGHYTIVTLNTCNALFKKELEFMEHEKNINNTTYYNILGVAEKGVISEQKALELYKSAKTELNAVQYKPEYDLLIDYIKNLSKFRDEENSLIGIYERFKYFATSLFSEYTFIADIKKRNMFFDKMFNKLINWQGIKTFYADKKLIMAEELEVAQLPDIFILDFYEFLFNPFFKNAKVLFCANCNDMFISSNNKAKFCTICKQPNVMSKIRYATRKANQARKLHHDITTMAYRLNTTDNDVSNAFLNESNYYWSIIQGEKPKK